jgi:hypothetical protein
MASAGERLDLAEFFAHGVEPADVAPLYPLLGARGLIAACLAVFRGGEAEVMVRLLVLREIGARADNPSWSPRELEMHFAFIDPVKLETVLKRLREHDLLVWDSEKRTYQLSPTGRMVLAALSTLLQFSAEDDAELGYLTAQIAAGGATGRISPENLQHLLARLAELEEEFSSAVASGSEFRLHAAQSKLASVWQWMEKGTEIMRGLTADGLPDDATWRLAQEIGARQSRIMRMTGVFQRELAAIARQRVHLSQGGLTSSELAAWLTTRHIDQLADFAVGVTHLVPEIPFVLPDVMADVAEFELLERQRPEQRRSTLPAAVDAENTSEIPREPPPELAALTRLLADLAARDEELAVADAIVGDSFRAAAYRFSLLPFLGDPSGDPELTAFGALPLTLCWAEDETLATPQRNEVAAISRGTILPRKTA